MLKKLVGDKAFYKYVILLALPIMIQNGITHLVNMLDNIMIGSIGQSEMSGVSIANTLIFVFNLCIFGAVSGAGIFGAQFAGIKDTQGITYTLRFKMLFCGLFALLAVGVFSLWGEPLITLYLQGEGDAADAAAILSHAKEYLSIMLIGLVPFALVQCYGSTLRETGQTTPPMAAGVVAVLVNLIGNYILIYGHFGAPKLGVAGAAIATVISRFVELAVLVIWTHTHKERNPFAPLLFRGFHIPLRLAWRITLKGMPLMVNEAAWSLGIATMNRQYSLRGLDVVGASNISQTFWNVFAVSFMAVGVAVGIIVGQKLGEGDKKGAKADSMKLIAFSTAIGIGVTIVYCLLAPFIPYLYDITPSVHHLAVSLMIVSALSMPLDAFAHASYFTLRSGGQAFITFLFDSVYTWAVNVPLAFCLIQYTDLPIVAVFAACHFVNIIKCFLGMWLVKKGKWIKTIV